MDDAFVLAAAWKMTDPSLGLVDRMASTYEEAAMSVTITTLTDIVSFAIGACMTNLRGVFGLCLLSGISELGILINTSIISVRTTNLKQTF